MANINIPESVIPGIRAIGLLDDKQINLLYEVLRKSTKGSQPDLIEEQLKVALDTETAALVSRAIFSFGYLLVRNENEDGNLAENLKDSFLKLTVDDEVSQSLGEVIVERLNDILLLCDFLIPTYEAQRIIWDSNKVIRSTNVTTEIVLVNDKAYSIPASGIMLNKIHLDVQYSGDETREISFVLDNDDLIKLKKQIESIIKENDEMRNKYSSLVNFIQI